MNTFKPRPGWDSECLPPDKEPRAEAIPLKVSVASRDLLMASCHILAHVPHEAFPTELLRTGGAAVSGQRPDRHFEDTVVPLA